MEAHHVLGTCLSYWLGRFPKEGAVKKGSQIIDAQNSFNLIEYFL